MIRSVWVALVAALATLFFGLVAILGSLLRVRDRRLYFWATQRWSQAILLASGTPVRAYGMERVDWSAPRILLANHLSNYDILALSGVLPAPFAFVAKKELERIPFFGTAWKAAGHVSIDRSDRQKALASLRHAGDKIRREHSTVIIFPEGTRSRTGELQPFKKGAFMLSLESGVPVVPVVVRGSESIQRPGSWAIRPRPIHLFFGDPIDPASTPGIGVEGYMNAVRERMVAMLRDADLRLPPPPAA